jgi:hypothetical protein
MKNSKLAGLAYDPQYLGKIKARAEAAEGQENPSEQDQAALELMELSKALAQSRGILKRFMAQMAFTEAFQAYAERYSNNP